MPKPCTPPANLLGIHVRYCVNGVQKDEWVDLTKVHAITWCDGEMEAKGKGLGGSAKLPATREPGPCPAGPLVPTGAPMCWWNGTEWVCGETQ
jgi:hypothetical protein